MNTSYPGYLPIISTDVKLFTELGLYNITLFTYTDSRGTPSDISVPNGIYNYWDNISIEYTAHEPAGTYFSPVFDTGSYAMWKNLSWSESLPYGTDITMYVRTGNSSVPTDSIWSGWSNPLSDPSGSAIGRPWGRYVQYRAELTTGLTNVTPVLGNVTLTYDKYQPEGLVETMDFLPDQIRRWGYFTYDATENGQGLAFWYSIDSGITWLSTGLGDDLRDLPVTASGIRLRAELSTADTVVTPVLRSLSINYTTTFPSMSLEPVWGAAGAEPGETTRLHIHFNNSAPSISATAWLNVYLDENLEYAGNNSASVPTFSSYITDTNPGTRKYVFSAIPQGSNWFWLDAAVKPGTHDGDILETTVTLEYLGPLGKRVESLLSKALLRVDGPVLAAEMVALNATGDVGDRMDYLVYVNNTGMGDAAAVWLNGTLDDRFSGDNISVELGLLEGGTGATVPFNVTIRDNVVQGSSIPMAVSVEYSDSAGYMASPQQAQATVNAQLRSWFSLDLLTQAEALNSSDMVVLTVFFNNTGYGSAESIQLELAIPEGLEYLTSSEECLFSDDVCYWELENVGPGPHSFTVTLRALVMDDGIFQTSAILIWMQVNDPVDGARPAVGSNSLYLEIDRVYTLWERIYWPWSGIAAAVIISATAFGLWYVFRPVPPSIDDAFVLYKDGRLISHRRSKSKPKSELDGDLVGAMLTAVQQFISDSLSSGGEGKVKKLEFGDRELYLERGMNINIALVYSGSMNRKLKQQIQDLTSKIEADHPNLEGWDGRMTSLADIHAQVDAVVDAWQTAAPE